MNPNHKTEHKVNQNDKQMLAALIMAGLTESLPCPKTAASAECVIMALRGLEDVILGLHPDVNPAVVNEGVAFLKMKLGEDKASLN